MIKLLLYLSIFLKISAGLFAQEKRFSFSVFAGPNYSIISDILFNEPIFNESDGPKFNLGYQLGTKVSYQINEYFQVSSGIRFLDRRSNNISNTSSNGIQNNGYMKGIAALGELSFRPNNSNLSLTFGGNFETILWSSSGTLPAYNSPGLAFFNGAFKSRANYYIWNAYAGVNYHLNRKFSFGLNYERLISTYRIKYYDEDPFSFAPKGTISRFVPLGFQLNLNYKF